MTVPFSDVCNGGIVQQQFTACTEQLGETRKSCSFLIDHLQNTGNVQSNSTATVVEYRGNPIQNIQQMLEYANVDNTLFDFLDQMRDQFLVSIPETLIASGSTGTPSTASGSASV